MALLALLNACKRELALPLTFDITEGQSNWVKIPYDTLAFGNEYEGHNVNNIFFIDEHTGYLGGFKKNYEGQSFIFKTTNGGETWLPNYYYGCGAGSATKNVFFLTPAHGIASVSCLGEVLAETFDGGATWSKRNDFIYFNDAPKQFAVFDSLNVYVGNYITSNAGSTWAPLNLPQHTKAYSFTDLSQGVCVTDNGLVAQTQNGGNTWDTLYYNSVHKYYSVCITAPLCIIAGGNHIVKSTDGGVNWNVTASEPDVTDIKFVSKNIGFAAVNVKNDANIKGRILKTTDGGNSWSVNYYSSFIGFTSLSIINPHTLIGSGTQKPDNKLINKAYIIKTNTQGN